MTSRFQYEANFQDERIEQGGDERKFMHLIREEHPFLIKSIGNVHNKKILTMACATGGVTPFARQGARTIGIDISPKAIFKLSFAIKNEKLSNHASVSLMNCEELGFKENSFDIVLFIGALHHLDVKKTMGETYRVLKPGGKAFISEPLGLHPLICLYRRLTPQLRTKYEHPLKPKDFKIMTQFFKIEHFKAFCLFSVFSLFGLIILRSNRIYESLRNNLNKFDNFLFKYIPFLKYFSWSAVIELKKKY